MTPTRSTTAAPALQRRRWLALTVLPLLGLAAGRARAIGQPQGPVVLSVLGAVTQTNAGVSADFDMAMLAALPQRSFTTATPWYPQPVKFTGPLLRDVLAAAGASGQKLKAVALNDYKVEIEAGDARSFDVIVARLLDDKPMPVRDKGPLFIVYPYDSRPELKSERYYSRSAWQLRKLIVE